MPPDFLSIGRNLREKAALLLTLWVLLCGAPLHAASDEPATVAYKVLAEYPHDPKTFTQGLEIDDQTLLESSGLYGRSFITRGPLPPVTGPVAAMVRQPLPTRYFGEGLTVWKDKIYMVTWREQRGLIFDRGTLQPAGEFPIEGEGWGLAHSGKYLILSNGSAELQFLDPRTFAVQRRIAVHSGNKPVDQLNELEWISGSHGRPDRLLANIWQTDELAVIDPEDGRVTARIDLHGLYPRGMRSRQADVMNGIAFDSNDDTLLVTGKFWPHLYRIQLLQALP